MARYDIPLRVARLISLALVIVFSSITIAAVGHSFVAFNEKVDSGKATVSKLVPGATVNTDRTDVYNSGLIQGAAQICLFVISVVTILLILFDSRRKARAGGDSTYAPWSTRTLVLQVLCLVAAVIFALATAIATTIIVATKQAVITATLPGGIPLPTALVNTFEKELDVTPVYHKINYLIFLAVSPWFGFLFGAIAAAITIIAWLRPSTSTSDSLEPAERTSSNRSDEKS